MTLEDLGACFEKHSDEYIRFERIESPRHPRPDLCAFLMLHDLVPQSGDMVCAAEHDEIWLGVDEAALVAVATDDIVRDLVRCGVRYGSDTGSLAMFV